LKIDNLPSPPIGADATDWYPRRQSNFEHRSIGRKLHFQTLCKGYKNMRNTTIFLIFSFNLMMGCAFVSENIPEPEIRKSTHSPTTEKNKDTKSNGKDAKDNRTQEKKFANLEELVHFALHNNPAIQEARYKWQKAIEKYPQAISLPDPIVIYTYPLADAKTRVEMEQHKVTFMQEIPFPTKLYLQGEIAKNEANIARLSYERTIRDVAAQVQVSFYEVMYLNSAIQVTQQSQKILQHFVKVASVEFKGGATPLPDVLRAQSQLAQMEYDLVRLGELKAVEIAQLQSLLSHAHDEPLLLPPVSFPGHGPLPLFEGLYTHGLQHRQEILAAQIELSRMNREISMARAEYFPDLSIGFSWADVERDEKALPPMSGRNEWMLMLGVTLPIWVPKKNAKIREARFSAQSVAAMKKNLENEFSASLKKAYYKGVNAARLVELYTKSLLPQAQHSMMIAENWYRDSKGSLLGILEAQNIHLNFSLALARAQSDYSQSLIELAQLCGGVLPKALWK
jgi:outer membrane protein TolC